MLVVNVTRKEFIQHSPQELEMLLFKRMRLKQMQESAKKIQTNWKMIKARQFYRKIFTERLIMTKRIQKFWRRIRMLTLIPNAMKNRKNRAAI